MADDPEAAVLGSDVRGQMKLARGVAIHMTVKAGDAQAGLPRFTVIGGIELFLRERGEELPAARVTGCSFARVTRG